MKLNINKWIAGMVVLFLVQLSFTGQAQNRMAIDVQVWAKGDVVLTNGDTVSGPLTFYRNLDIVNVQHKDGSISSFTPVSVLYFETTEMPGGRRHTFRTYPWDQGRDYTDFKKPAFFEQLNDGNITLIMRETYMHRDVSQAIAFVGSNYHTPTYRAPEPNSWLEQVQEVYFALLPNGEIMRLRKPRRDLSKLFGKKWSQVKSFAKKENLTYESPHEMLAVVNYYNSLP